MAALKPGGVPQSVQHKLSPETNSLSAQNRQPPSSKPYKQRINTLLLVATLITTITFACGFTIPGGNNNESGTATLLSKGMFQAFLICNTIATYSSLMAVVILIAAQLEDLTLILTALRVALPLIGVSLSTMSFAFAAGVYLVVRNLRWLAIVVLVLGSVFACILVMLYVQLCARLSSRNRVLRHLFYHSFCLMVWATGSDTDVAKE